MLTMAGDDERLPAARGSEGLTTRSGFVLVMVLPQTKAQQQSGVHITMPHLRGRSWRPVLGGPGIVIVAEFIVGWFASRRGE